MAFVRRINHRIQRDWDVRVMHIFREAKRVADCLAALGHSFPLGLHFYCVPRILVEEGVAMPRRII